MSGTPGTRSVFNGPTRLGWPTTRSRSPHSRGIVHRDVKPGNILVNSQGTIKLVDFGLAKAFATVAETESAVTMPGTFVGTLHYAAPEVLTGRPADARSDLYSLGVVLYEMACGVLPFAGIEGPAFIAAVLRGDAPPLRQRNPAVSPVLAAVVSPAMAVRPEDRFGTAAELRAALSARGPAAASQPAQAASAALAVLEFENLSHDLWFWLAPASPRPSPPTRN